MPVEDMFKRGLSVFFMMNFREELKSVGRGTLKTRKIRRKKRSIVASIKGISKKKSSGDSLREEIITFVFFSQKGEEEDIAAENVLEGELSPWKIEESAVREQDTVEYFLLLGYGVDSIHDACFSPYNVGFLYATRY